MLRRCCPLQKGSWCILHPKPTVPQETRWCGSYSSTEKQLMYFTAQPTVPQETGWCGSYSSTEKQWCILQPQLTVPQDTRWCGSNSSTEKKSMYSTAPADCATGVSLVWVLHFNRKAVDVFYSPSRLCHRSLFGVGVTPQQKSSRCILQPKSTVPQETRWCGGYTSTEKQSMYSTAPADCAIGVESQESTEQTNRQI